MSLYYPKLNPIVLPDGKCCEYAQPFNLSDSTTVVLVQDSIDMVVPELQLVSEYGVPARVFPLNSTVTIGDFKLMVYAISFDGLDAGLYRFLVNAVRQTIKSGPICLAQSHEDTVEVVAYNSDNIQDIPFESGVQIRYRFHGGFFDKALNPKSDDASYQNEDADFVLLSSVPYESFTLNIGGMRGVTDSVQALANRVFSLDTTLIDGVSFTKFEGAEWSAIEEDGYGLRSWELEVVRTENRDSEEIVDYPDYAYWSSYYCVLDRQLYSYAVHVDDRTAKLSGTVTLTVEKADGSAYDMVKAYKGFGDVVFEVPVDDTVTGAVMTASGNLDTANVQVLGSTRPLFERSARVSSTALPATVALLPAGTRIGKDGSSMLHVIINQPL